MLEINANCSGTLCTSISIDRLQMTIYQSHSISARFLFAVCYLKIYAYISIVELDKRYASLPVYRDGNHSQRARNCSLSAITSNIDRDLSPFRVHNRRWHRCQRDSVGFVDCTCKLKSTDKRYLEQSTSDTGIPPEIYHPIEFNVLIIGKKKNNAIL